MLFNYCCSVRSYSKSNLTTDKLFFSQNPKHIILCAHSALQSWYQIRRVCLSIQLYVFHLLFIISSLLPNLCWLTCCCFLCRCTKCLQIHIVQKVGCSQTPISTRLFSVHTYLYRPTWWLRGMYSVYLFLNRVQST